MRLALTTGTVISLLAGSLTVVSAQEASPEPVASTDPVASAEPTAMETADTAAPPPMADYWNEWAEHKAASRGRVDLQLDNVRNARKKKVRFHKQAVAAYGDELAWLSHHQPEDCYAEEYELWRAAIEDLAANAARALKLEKSGKCMALKQLAKPRAAAVKRLDMAMSSVADCGPSAMAADAITPPGEAFAGTWKSRDDIVELDGFHDSSRVSLSIEPDGRFAGRDSIATGCRSAGHGYVPWSGTGIGELRSDGVPVFVGSNTRSFCHPRRGKPRVRMPWDDIGEFRYDATYDVCLPGQVGLLLLAR